MAVRCRKASDHHKQSKYTLTVFPCIAKYCVLYMQSITRTLQDNPYVCSPTVYCKIAFMYAVRSLCIAKSPLCMQRILYGCKRVNEKNSKYHHVQSTQQPGCEILIHISNDDRMQIPDNQHTANSK